MAGNIDNAAIQKLWRQEWYKKNPQHTTTTPPQAKLTILLNFAKQISKSLEMLNVLAMVKKLTPNIHQQVLQTQLANK